MVAGFGGVSKETDGLLVNQKTKVKRDKIKCGSELIFERE